jgi:class 3 adenylate cyclase
MEWNVVCSCCAKISQSLRDLHSLQSQSTCKLCFRKEHANLDDSVQISFTLSPAVRSLRFHHPETLSLEEYCFNYLFEPSTIVNGMMPLMDAFQYIQKDFYAFSPGDKKTVETEVGVGSLTCLDVFGQKSFGLIASGAPQPEVQKIAVKFTDSGFELPLSEMDPGEFMVGPLTYAGTFYAIHPGKVRLEFEQRASAKTALLVGFFPIPLDGLQALEVPAVFTENYPELANTLEKLKAGGFDNIVPPNHSYSTPRLTAKQLFASQTFHDLFRSEVFQEAEGFGIKDVTILFTDLKSSTQLYQQIGDLNAYALVREHYGILNQAVLNHHGAVVKTIGDAIMANFTQPVEAVAAGHEMLKELRKLNRTSAYGDLILKIGIHRGAAISVTLNERIDYFGQTVNIASRVQGSAGGNEIYITEEIYSAPGVRPLLESQRCKIESAEVHLKGIEEQIKIYKVTDLD